MAIERFTKEQFEGALPKGYWTELGMLDGEYSYVVKVSPIVNIMVRSSIHYDGLAADTGKDSIRCWLVNENSEPIGNKLQSYVTRVKGWQTRLLDELRELWRMGSKASKPCVVCGSRLGVFTVKKDGPNKGRKFLKCQNTSCGDFSWLEERS